MSHDHLAPFTRARRPHHACEDDNLKRDLAEVVASVDVLLVVLGVMSLAALVYTLFG